MSADHSTASKRSIFSWCLYDWANTAFGTVIITFIYSIYFAQGIYGEETAGASMWSYAVGASGLLIALLSPVFGAIADRTGRRKPWLAVFTAMCAGATACLFFGTPGMGMWGIAFILGCLIVANIGLEMGVVFYNAMLPDLVRHERMGRVSGLAWAMGYLGGLSCLILALFGLVGLGESGPLLPVPETQGFNYRACALLTALWLMIFALPLFLFTPDVAAKGRSSRRAVREGLKQLKTTITHIRGHKNLVTFLVASALYRDGLNTLFAMGGLYAAGQFDMNIQEVMIFAIGLNISAGLGAAAFAYLDDLKGSKLTILIALGGLIATGAVILMVEDRMTFTALAIFLGIFIGPAQAASRTFAGRLAPPEMVTQTYGFYALTGKSIAFLGPIIYGLATAMFGTQQAGMVTIILFWSVGAALLTRVKEG